MVHYKLVKITISTLGLAKMIINIVMRHYGLTDSIITYWSCSSPQILVIAMLFFGIKQRLSTAFHP